MRKLFRIITKGDIFMSKTVFFNTSDAPTTSSCVNWRNLATVEKIEKNEDELCLYVTVNDETEILTVTFPTCKGVRVCGKNQGFFKPDGACRIKYLEEQDGTVMLCAENGERAVFKTESDGWSLELLSKSEKAATKIEGKKLWYGYRGKAVVRTCVENSLSADEVIFGLGERFNSLNRVGIKTELKNQDAWSLEDTSYKNIPIIHSTNGYMLFFNCGAVGIADIGEDNPQRYLLDICTDKFDFYLWAGTPLENLSAYSMLTGRPMLPPKWAFRYMPGATTIGWESTGDAMSLMKYALEGYEKYGISDVPAVYGEDSFRGKKEGYDYVNGRGVRMLAWNHPFQMDINLREKNCAEFLPEHSTAPEDYELPVFRKISHPEKYSDVNTVDFSHPAAKELIKALWGKDIEMGLRGLMIDYGEQVEDLDAVSYAGIPAVEARNFHVYHYLKSFHDVFNELIGEGEWFSFGRNAAAGTQKYCCNFAGDQTGTFDGLRRGINAIITLSTCGFSTCHSDLGGLGGPPTKELYNRWVQSATFNPVMISIGSDGAEVPWEQGDMDIFLKHYWLREALVDKIYSSAIIANKTALPIVKAMAMAYPEEKALWAEETEYIFCDDILVCPIINEGAISREVILPKGSWINLFTGESYEGGGAYDVAAPMEYSPAFIRDGAVIPIKVAADSLSLFESSANGNSAEGLLVTAPDGERVSDFWSNTQTKTVYTSKREDNGFAISADREQTAKAILLYGNMPLEVLVDGKALPQDACEQKDNIVRIRLNEDWQKIEFRY